MPSAVNSVQRQIQKKPAEQSAGKVYLDDVLIAPMGEMLGGVGFFVDASRTESFDTPTLPVNMIEVGRCDSSIYNGSRRIRRA